MKQLPFVKQYAFEPCNHNGQHFYRHDFRWTSILAHAPKETYT